MSLVSYSDSCSDSEIEETSQEDKANCKKLLSAEQILGKRKISDTEENFQDNPQLHDGRIRSFKHVRGNWATYVYIPVMCGLLDDIQTRCFSQLYALDNIKLIKDLHISLSKTIVLQYHLIESFVESLKSAFTVSSSFQIIINQLVAYTNSERTRTFVALKIDPLYIEKMLNLLKCVNNVMNNFRQSTFYEEPSFHISFLWCLGDKLDMINSYLPQLESHLQDSLNIRMNIQKICCKSGFKEFTFTLK